LHPIRFLVELPVSESMISSLNRERTGKTSPAFEPIADGLFDLLSQLDERAWRMQNISQRKQVA
jgi:hypothetical protein